MYNHFSIITAVDIKSDKEGMSVRAYVVMKCNDPIHNTISLDPDTPLNEIMQKAGDHWAMVHDV